MAISNKSEYFNDVFSRLWASETSEDAKKIVRSEKEKASQELDSLPGRSGFINALCSAGIKCEPDNCIPNSHVFEGVSDLINMCLDSADDYQDFQCLRDILNVSKTLYQQIDGRVNLLVRGVRTHSAWETLSNWELLMMKQIRDELKTIVLGDEDTTSDADFLKREIVFKKLKSLSEDLMLFGIQKDEAKTLVKKFCGPFGLSAQSKEVLMEKIDCWGKSVEQIVQMRKEREEVRRESWVGSITNLFAYNTQKPSLLSKTSPKVTPSKGEVDEEFEPDRGSAEIEVVHQEVNEDDLEMLRDNNMISPDKHIFSPEGDEAATATPEKNEETKSEIGVRAESKKIEAKERKPEEEKKE